MRLKNDKDAEIFGSLIDGRDNEVSFQKALVMELESRNIPKTSIR